MEFNKNIKKNLENICFGFKNFDTINIDLILSINCNLKCKHCCCYDFLDKKINYSFNYIKFINFINILRNNDKNKKITINLLGGEIGLVSGLNTIVDNIIRDIDNCEFNLSTNLVNIPDISLDNLQKFKSIQVSLDGNKHTHDKHRCKTFNNVIKNIFYLKKNGLNNLTINCVLHKDIKNNTDIIREFVNICLMLNIDKNHIKFSDLYPNEFFLPKKITTRKLFNIPCCSYRFMSNFSITPDCNIWSGYFGCYDNDFYIGNLDNINYNKFCNNFSKIIKNAHFITDNNCLNCPAVARCFGLGCFGCLKFYKKKFRNIKPSDLCDKNKNILLLNEYDEDLVYAKKVYKWIEYES